MPSNLTMSLHSHFWQSCIAHLPQHLLTPFLYIFLHQYSKQIQQPFLVLLNNPYFLISKKRTVWVSLHVFFLLHQLRSHHLFLSLSFTHSILSSPVHALYSLHNTPFAHISLACLPSSIPFSTFFLLPRPLSLLSFYRFLLIIYLSSLPPFASWCFS